MKDAQTKMTTLQTIFCSNVLTYTDKKDTLGRLELRFFGNEEDSAVRWFFKHTKEVADTQNKINQEKAELWNKFAKEIKKESENSSDLTLQELEAKINEKEESKVLIKKEIDWLKEEHQFDFSEKTKAVLIKYVSDYKPTTKDLNLKFEVLEILGVVIKEE